MVTTIKHKCSKKTVSLFENFSSYAHYELSIISLTKKKTKYVFLFHFVFTKYRYRLSSSSEDDEEAIPIHDDFEAYMQFRDGLQEFRGQIPPRKKKETNETKTRSRKSRVSIPATTIPTINRWMTSDFFSSRSISRFNSVFYFKMKYEIKKI